MHEEIHAHLPLPSHSAMTILFTSAPAPTFRISAYSILHRLGSCDFVFSLLILLLLQGFLAKGVALSPDGEALLAFRSTMQGPDARLEWRPEDQSPCSWYGVRCNSNGRVVELSVSVYLHGSVSPELGKLSELRVLNLSFCNMTGSIPKELGSLAILETLDLSSNQLSGSIPRELGSLSRLRSLILHANRLGGSIPLELCNASSLRELWLHDNNLTGTLPSHVGNLTSLETLRIGGNAMLYGPLPPELGNCRNLTQLGAAVTAISGSIPSSMGLLGNLQILALYSTRISGTIPFELGNCTNLQLLFLHLNHLSGPIPPQIGRLNQLNQLLLWGNSFEGRIPAEIGNCMALEVLDLSSNSLSGPIPMELGNLSALQQLLLSINLLNGSLPSELSNCVSLTDLELDNNDFSGSIPPTIGKLENLETLFLWRNRLTGTIPPGIEGCVALEAVDLSYNQLTGPIPKELFALQNLVKLILLSNNFTGSLPPEVGNCRSLIRLRLASNAISGPLPKELGLLDRLEFLDLFENQFEGPIPPQLCNLTSLQAMDAHGNKLTGSLPAELASMRSLQQLDLGSNQLSGSIPAEITRLSLLNKLVLRKNSLSGTIPRNLDACKKLALLDLSHNFLEGSIPDEIGNITSLEIALNLSWNNLSGHIPEGFSQLSQLQSLDLSVNSLSGSLSVLSSMESLAFLNVSYNSFSGPVPNTPFFRTLSRSSIMGNPGLCDSISRSCDVSDGMDGPRSGVTSLLICLFVSAAAAILVVFGLLLMYRMRKVGGEVDLEEVDSPWPWSVTYFCKLNLSVDDILDELMDRNVIGRGCSGLVYKVEVPGGICLAVKKLWTATRREDLNEHDSFGAEIETLGRIRHRNIVRLLGYCTNRTERLLIYDYMTNGSLADLLFEKRGMVDWEMRYDIILGAAHGLAYLHHDCVPAILHRDVKSNNILLDSNFQPYLADFGLAKLVETSERKNNMSKVAGSYGYIAPEYGYTLKITEKSDVYSYGVVLLEVITGRRAVEPGASDGQHVVEWVRMMKRNCRPTAEIVDPRLRGMPDPFMQEMAQVLGVALLCVNRSPPERPTMKDVVALLQEAKHPLEEYNKLSQPLLPDVQHQKGGSDSGNGAGTTRAGRDSSPPSSLLQLEPPHSYVPATSRSAGAVQPLTERMEFSTFPAPAKRHSAASRSG
ncbi:hypothetical protein KP509_32G075000 [Ceratopteris richardii]|uniref:Protein kinase domain-containing protein n=1 Tax=Ceratopteris richardii TaxID=49495 RepID=A0A8T2QUY5_CERRI|nr:hypothetical protein KP509_32G075000 [Ceratopteris richardii]